MKSSPLYEEFPILSRVLIRRAHVNIFTLQQCVRIEALSEQCKKFAPSHLKAIRKSAGHGTTIRVELLCLADAMRDFERDFKLDLNL